MRVKLNLTLTSKEQARLNNLRNRVAGAGQAAVGRFKELKSKIPTVSITINKGE